MPIRLDEYLQAHGFSGHPFGSTNAENEARQLPSFFVRATWFDWLVGDPQYPESLILFAPQGYGKTSHRLEVARLAGERRELPALVAEFDDFQPLLADHAPIIPLDTYIRQIRYLTLRALDQQIRRSPARQAALRRNTTAAARLHALWQLFAPSSLNGRSAPDGTEAHARYYEIEPRGPKAWLIELAELAMSIGFASIYILLDGFDEMEETRRDSEVIFRLLRPLLDAPGLLQECGFAFKFFLPQNLEPLMREQGVGRLDRVPHRILTWTEDDLLKMLSQRLVSYNRISSTSPRSRVSTFQDLCDVPFDADLYLVQVAAGSPRTLISLAHDVIAEHCARVDNRDALINAETINAVLQAWQIKPLVLETVPAPAVSDVAPAVELPVAPVPQPIRSLNAPTPPLFVDPRGDIWLGERRLQAPLTKMGRICLTHLWEHRDRLVTYDELQHVLYGVDLEERGDPRSSLDKIIRRLRSALEPGKPTSRTYIDINIGIGYVLRNYRELLL